MIWYIQQGLICPSFTQVEYEPCFTQVEYEALTKWNTKLAGAAAAEHRPTSGPLALQEVEPPTINSSKKMQFGPKKITSSRRRQGRVYK